jgi:hypothetical protein
MTRRTKYGWTATPDPEGVSDRVSRIVDVEEVSTRVADQFGRISPVLAAYGSKSSDVKYEKMEEWADLGKAYTYSEEVPGGTRSYAVHLGPRGEKAVRELVPGGWIWAYPSRSGRVRALMFRGRDLTPPSSYAYHYVHPDVKSLNPKSLGSAFAVKLT